MKNLIQERYKKNTLIIKKSWLNTVEIVDNASLIVVGDPCNYKPTTNLLVWQGCFDGEDYAID